MIVMVLVDSRHWLVLLVHLVLLQLLTYRMPTSITNIKFHMEETCPSMSPSFY